MTDFFSTPDDTGEIRQSDLQASLGERLGAQARDSLTSLDVFHQARLENAGGGSIGVPGAGGEVDVFSGQPLEQRQAASDAFRAAVPDTSIDDAKARVKQEGLEGHLQLPDQASIKAPVLDLMIQHAHDLRDREAAIARGPQGLLPGALGLITSLGVGMIDPLNMAAFSVPVLGEARWGKLLANAGDSVMARAGVRALQGGVQGAAGTTLLQPVDWWLHTQDGRDYTMADALKSIAMGAGMGAAFHAGGGMVGDLSRKARGRPLAGSPEDLLLRGLMAGTHVRGEALAEEGVPLEQVPGIEPAPLHPAEVLADLPPAAQEDAFKATVADVIADRPARAAEVLQVAADHDPRIAESVEAWHGSPHDFDRFDVSKIGTGEGAQSFGHGIYFAENEKVALAYKQKLSDKAFVDKVRELYDEGFSPDDAWAEIKDNWKDFTPAEQRLMAALEKDDWLGFDYPHQAVSAALRDIKGFDVSPETSDAARAMGNMYRVKVTANHEHMLDWDKPFSEQSDHVKAALTKLGYDQGVAGSGEDVFRQLSLEHTKYGEPDQNGMRRSLGPQNASSALQEAGIPGIKYLDQGSRGKGEGTRNFVVFDDKHIEITHKNGEPVKESALDAANRIAREARAADPEFYAQRERNTTVTINGRAHEVDYPSHGERAAAAANDPRWRELADAPPAHSTPDAISESHAADAVAEPASVTPKALTAIEQAATEAEEAWRKVEGSYTEAERAIVNDALAKLDLDRKEVEDLITEGAACLMAAEAA